MLARSVIFTITSFLLFACGSKFHCDDWRREDGYCAITPTIVNERFETVLHEKVYIHGFLTVSDDGEIFVYGSADEAINGSIMNRVLVDPSDLDVESQGFSGKSRVYGIVLEKNGIPFIKMERPFEPGSHNDSVDMSYEWLLDERLAITIVDADLIHGQDFWKSHEGVRKCLKGSVLNSLVLVERSFDSKDVFLVQLECRRDSRNFKAEVNLVNRTVSWSEGWYDFDQFKHRYDAPAE